MLFHIFFNMVDIYIDTSSTKSSPDLPSLLPFSTTSAIFLVFQGKKTSHHRVCAIVRGCMD